MLNVNTLYWSNDDNVSDCVKCSTSYHHVHFIVLMCDQVAIISLSVSQISTKKITKHEIYINPNNYTRCSNVVLSSLC